MHREKLSTACVFIICINLCLFMCLLDLDDLTYACKDTEVAWIYWIFWKPGETLVICYIAFFHLQNFSIFIPCVVMCACPVSVTVCCRDMQRACHRCLRPSTRSVWGGYSESVCVIASPTKKSCNALVNSLFHSHFYPHNVLPSWGLLSVWANPPWHTWLFDFTSTHHSANSQIVRGIAAQVVLISSGRIS